MDALGTPHDGSGFVLLYCHSRPIMENWGGEGR